jgi:hypothetical protein
MVVMMMISGHKIHQGVHVVGRRKEGRKGLSVQRYRCKGGRFNAIAW